MNTGLVFFTAIVLQWDPTHGGSWPSYSVLSVSSADLKAIGIQPPSWLFGSPWSDDRAKSSLEENENESENDERLLKHHAWNFIKKLKGKTEEEEPKKVDKKKKKKKTQDTGSPLLSASFLTSLFGEEPAANETETVDDLSSLNSNSSTTVPPPLIIDTSTSDPDPVPASEENETVEIIPTTKPPQKIKIKKRPLKAVKATAATKANATANNSDEDSEEKEDDDGEDSEEDDEEEEEEEVEDDEEDENDDKKNSGDDPEEIILDTAPKGPDGSDVMEPADLKMLGKKADLYLRINKAHQSAKQFLGVFKGVYVDYVKNRPFVGIEVGTRGRNFDENSYGVISRMGHPWKYADEGSSDRVYHEHHRPKIYFAAYDDNYENLGLPNSNQGFFMRQYENPNIMYTSRRSVRDRSENIFPYDIRYNYYDDLGEPYHFS